MWFLSFGLSTVSVLTYICITTLLCSLHLCLFALLHLRVLESISTYWHTYTHTHTNTTCQFSTPLRLAATNRKFICFYFVFESRTPPPHKLILNILSMSYCYPPIGFSACTYTSMLWEGWNHTLYRVYEQCNGLKWGQLSAVSDKIPWGTLSYAEHNKQQQQLCVTYCTGTQKSYTNTPKSHLMTLRIPVIPPHCCTCLCKLFRIIIILIPAIPCCADSWEVKLMLTWLEEKKFS